MACSSGHVCIVKELIENSAEVVLNQVNGYYWAVSGIMSCKNMETPFVHVASMKGHAAVVEIF